MIQRFAGMTYEQANHEATRLIERAHVTGAWLRSLPEELMDLRTIMVMHLDKYGAEDGHWCERERVEKEHNE
jgi:hypothetical protein